MKSAIKAYDKKCRICKTQKWLLFYKGPVRMGKFGDYSKNPQSIWECAGCKAAFFDRAALDYESEKYRDAVDGASSPEHFYAMHDSEQTEKIQFLGTGGLRGRTIVDIGCGAGSFLDLVKGYAAATVAVEPASGFHKELKHKGHKTYSYTKDVLKDWRGKVDIAVSFAVLEHIEFPLEFLKEIRSLLKPGGKLVISTPNRDDWMIGFSPRDYAKFFFRHVHTWYFDKRSVENIGKLAGFKNIEVRYLQRFDLSNALLWGRDRCPTGTGAITTLADLDRQYKSLVESKGRSDFIYASLSR